MCYNSIMEKQGRPFNQSISGDDFTVIGSEDWILEQNSRSDGFVFDTPPFWLVAIFGAVFGAVCASLMILFFTRHKK